MMLSQQEGTAGLPTSRISHLEADFYSFPSWNVSKSLSISARFLFFFSIFLFTRDPHTFFFFWTWDFFFPLRNYYLHALLFICSNFAQKSIPFTVLCVFCLLHCWLTQRGTRAGITGIHFDSTTCAWDETFDLLLLLFTFTVCMQKDFHALVRKDLWNRITLHIHGSVIIRHEGSWMQK